VHRTLLLAGKDLALECDLADIEPIAQEMGERAAGEWDPANRAPGLEGSHPVRRSLWRMAEVFGGEPRFDYFETPDVIDNAFK
jgi:hypothetical protein